MPELQSVLTVQVESQPTVDVGVAVGVFVTVFVGVCVGVFVTVFVITGVFVGVCVTVFVDIGTVGVGVSSPGGLSVGFGGLSPLQQPFTVSQQ